MSGLSEQSSKIKEQFLVKLSKELIKRGVSSEEETEILNEMNSTLNSYLEKQEPANLQELEAIFGTVDYICNEYGITSESSKAIRSWLFWIEIVIASISIVAIPVVGLILFKYDHYWGFGYNPPYLYGSLQFFIDNLKATMFYSKGYGVLGSLLGMLVYTWILQKFFSNRYSKYDRRKRINICILISYWVIVLIWVMYVVLFADYLIHNLQNNAELIFIQLFIDNYIEIGVRWLLLGVILITNAVYFSMDVKKSNVKDSASGEERSQNMNYVSAFFIISCFTVSNPIVGILIISVGLLTLLFNQINGKQWFLGLGAIIVHSFILLQWTSLKSVSNEAYRIIFGFRIEYKLNSTMILVTIFGLVAISWSFLCFVLINKKNQRFLPRFKLPKFRQKGKSMLLLLIVIIAILGSQPYENYYDREITLENGTFEEIFEIPSAGRIYLYVNSNDTLVNSWNFIWRPTKNFPILLEESSFDSYSDGDNRTIFTYTLKVSRPGILEFKWDLSEYLEDYEDWGTFLREVRIGPNAYWNSRLYLFPTITEIITLAFTALVLFLDWDKRIENQKKILSSKEGV